MSELAGVCSFNAASALQPDLPSHPSRAATEDDRPQCRLYRFIFPIPQETYKSSAFPGQPHGPDQSQTVPYSGPKGHSRRRGSNTVRPLLPVFGKQTLEADNSNTACKPPHHCQLLTHASEDKNATLGETAARVQMGDLSDEMRPAQVILILHSTQKHSHRETDVKQGLSTLQQVEV